MREYGKVYSAFWQSEDIRSMSEDGRTLAFYLMTCPHGNMLGCFWLPLTYAAEDMQWEPERVSKAFDELFQKGFAYRCNRSHWVFIRNYLKWNPFENPNVAIKAFKLLDSLRIPVAHKGLLIKALREFGKHFDSSRLDPLERNLEPFENPFETLSKTIAVTIAVTKPEPEPQTHVASAPVGSADDVASPLKPDRRKEHRASDDVKAVFAYWQQAMSHPQAKLDDKRAKAIGKRLGDGYSVEDLCRAVDGCKLSPHHMGQNDTGTVYDDIELICRDGSKVDGFIARAQRGPVVLAPAGGQNRQEQLEQANREVVRRMMAAEGGNPQ